jgi:hypothetical protein
VEEAVDVPVVVEVTVWVDDCVVVVVPVAVVLAVPTEGTEIG